MILISHLQLPLVMQVQMRHVSMYNSGLQRSVVNMTHYIY